MNSLQSLELLVRGVAIGAFLSIAFGMARSARGPVRLSGTLFCLGAASHVLTQFPLGLRLLGYVSLPVWVLSVCGAGLFWAFARDLFSDQQKASIPRFAPALFLLALGVSGALAPAQFARFLWLSHNALGAAVLMLHALYLIAIGWRDDLVEPRRRLRGPMLAAGAVYVMITNMLPSDEAFWRSATLVSPATALVLLVLGLSSVFIFMRVDEALLVPPIARVQNPIPSVLISEGPERRRLHHVMEADEIWRREALSIGDLAHVVGVPEHRLRRIINGDLGYRNFSSYLNAHRITAATQALGDPSKARLTISAIAFETGFGSLGPFNRAFRDSVGVTPTQYRAQTAEALSISENADQN